MDAGIADTINRRDVTVITARLDALDLPKYRATHGPWYLSPMADVLMNEDEVTRSQRAWLVGQLAVNARGIAFDGDAAGGEWDNLFQHFRNAISARRDPKTPPARAVAIQPCGVV